MAQQTIATEPQSGRPPTTDEQIRKAEEEDEWDRESTTKSYFRHRVEDLPQYLDSLSDDKKHRFKKKLWVETVRIERSRERLAHSAKTKGLFDKLKETFREWRQEAEQRPGEDSVEFKYPFVERQHHFKTLESIGADNLTFPDEAGAVSEDPEHDFKAGFLFFEKHGIGWRKTDIEEPIFDIYDKFPDQKLSVHDALFNQEYNPFAQSTDEQGRRHLRYVHLPANHMGWVEVSLGQHACLMQCSRL